MKEVHFKDWLNYSKSIGKMIIAGDEGTGKTLLLTRIGIGKIQYKLMDIARSYEAVDEYNQFGLGLEKNYNHLCFANFRVNCLYTEMSGLESYKVNPYRLGLYDEDYETDFYPPYALFCITEARNYFNAYLYEKYQDWFVNFIRTCRQGSYDIVLDTQRFADIFVGFREITNRFIYCHEKVTHLYDKDGNCIGHKLHIIEWKSHRDVEVFNNITKKQNCEEYDLILDFCLFENYDSKFCRFLHLYGRMGQQFKIEHFPELKSYEDILNFAEDFGLIAPEGFYKSKNKQEKQTKEQDIPEVPELEEYEF